MQDPYPIATSGPIYGSIRPPGSKSITNRALVCAALARGTSTLTGALVSDDTQVMIESLRQIGIEIQDSDHGTRLIVQGCGGNIPAKTADLFIGNSGTTVRFLTAMLALGRGRYRLDGVARMRERPIGDLLVALDQLGVRAVSELGTGAPPVVIESTGAFGGTATVAGNISSQFLSGILLAAPLAKQDVLLKIDGDLVSLPYVNMTLDLIRQFGAVVERPTDRQFFVPAGQSYLGRAYAIEPDASAASYFWGAAAITGGKVTVEGLTRDAMQGDVQFCQCLQQMGCRVDYLPNAIEVQGGPLQGVDVDMNAISDTVQTLAAVALFANGPTRVRGVAHNRHKETDRIGDLATELRRLGAAVDEHDDGLTIQPGSVRPADIETYDDHRMAMSLALVGLRQEGIRIKNPSCTAKTYPAYFDDLKRLAAGH